MNNKRFLAIIIVIAITMMMLGGCAESKATSSATTGVSTAASGAATTTKSATSAATTTMPAPNMVLRMGMSVGLTTGDPHMTGSTTDQAILINIFDPLIRRDAKGKLQPKLALSWKNTEPTVWEFKLRSGVTFHNGEAFNAAAVKYSLERIFAADSKSPIVEMDNFKTVEAVDDLTVKITTTTPDPYVPDKVALFGGMMVPPKYIEQNGLAAFNSKPVGTGPFIFKEWIKDDHITMVANTKYWQEPTKLTELTIKFIPDAAARVAALLSGDVDLIDQVATTAINTVKNNTNLRLDTAEGIRIMYLSIAYPTGPTADVRVRQAISQAIDYQQIIDKLLGGYGVKIAGPYNTTNFGSDVKLTPYAFDLAKAKSLLAEAGYPNGFTIDLNTNAENSALGQVITDMLKQVGITVNFTVLPNAEYNDKYTNGKLAPLWINGYSVWQGDPTTLINTFFKTGMPRAKYSSPQLDAKIESMKSTLSATERLPKLQEILTTLHNDAPWVYLFQSNDVYGVSKKVTWNISYDRMFEFRTATITK